MSKEEIRETLELLGYSGMRLDGMVKYLKEWARRLSIVDGGALTKEDVVSASLIFDGFNRRKAN